MVNDKTDYGKKMRALLDANMEENRSGYKPAIVREEGGYGEKMRRLLDAAAKSIGERS